MYSTNNDKQFSWHINLAGDCKYELLLAPGNITSSYKADSFDAKSFTFSLAL